MKKVLLIAAVAAFAMTSCKKDYTCECKALGTTASAQIVDAKKKDAQKACDDTQAGWKILDDSATCELK